MRKSKFLTLVIAIMLVCSLAFVLTACGGDKDDDAETEKPAKPCRHDWVQTFDENNHWMQCNKCEEKKDAVAHTYVDDYHDTKHYKACTDCKYTKDADKHTKDWVVENDLHWEKCKHCNFTSVKAPHKFDAEGDCICGMTLAEHTHTPEEIVSFNGISHWHNCVGCNQQADVSVNHTIENGKCTGCAYFEGSTHVIYNENIVTGVDIDAILAEFEANKDPEDKDAELAPLNIVVSNANGKFVIDTVEGGAFANRDKVKILSVTLPETIKVIRSSAFSNRAELETINFAGTMEQWKKINKMYNWDNGTSENLKIVCKDGVIAKDGTETPTEPTEPEQPDTEQPDITNPDTTEPTDPDTTEPEQPEQPVVPPIEENEDNQEQTEN